MPCGGMRSVKLWRMEIVPFAAVGSSDLIVDRVYAGGRAGNRGDDPVSKVLPVGNSGGFRFVGSPTKGTVRALVLYTSLADVDWPDHLDVGTGAFTYYGDNKKPGRELHDTPRKGNLALREMFENALNAATREQVPPILLFSKGASGADAVFRGLLVPGSPAVAEDEQLVAIWRSSAGERFQNYRALFSVLDVRTVTRQWLNDIEAGNADASTAPREWIRWRMSGVPTRLMAPRSIEHRTREQQLPSSPKDAAVLATIHRYFSGRPHDFEACAAQLWMMMSPATDELEVTRPSRDGGRDAIGKYRIGPPADQIRINFALEAKCYGPTNSVGVREVSRLISRLRHRDFGVLVTTSYVHGQAYREIREDGHPVAVVCGRDIVDLLRLHGLTTATAVERWLATEFPLHAGSRADVTFSSNVDVTAAQRSV